jgi:DNA helicase-2/ATP-dependent DNA helicase PcrA
LAFVGMTRAKEELELSMATYREFRGQRRMSVPSPFLMELPRHDMHVVEPPRLQTAAWDAIDFAEDRAPPEMATAQLSAKVAVNLSTAAELHASQTAELTDEPADAHAQGSSEPAISPDDFHQGMVVRHPEYGLGKVIALGGTGVRRSATVAFASAAGQKKFMLSQSPLRPAKTT